MVNIGNIKETLNCIIKKKKFAIADSNLSKIFISIISIEGENGM